MAIYLEMPTGGILVCSEEFLDIPVGTWLYRPEELQGDLFGTDGVDILYIYKKI